MHPREQSLYVCSLTLPSNTESDNPMLGPAPGEENFVTRAAQIPEFNRKYASKQNANPACLAGGITQVGAARSGQLPEQTPCPEVSGRYLPPCSNAARHSPTRNLVAANAHIGVAKKQLTFQQDYSPDRWISESRALGNSVQRRLGFCGI